MIYLWAIKQLKLTSFRYYWR